MLYVYNASFYNTITNTAHQSPGIVEHLNMQISIIKKINKKKIQRKKQMGIRTSNTRVQDYNHLF